MAITRVATTDLDNHSGTTITISHPGGNCDAVFVWIDRWATVDATGVTYGGVAMTKLSSIVDLPTRSIWGLNDCYPGTQDVVVTQPDGSKTCIVGVATYKGVSRTATFPNTTNETRSPGGGGAPDNLTVAVTTTVDNCILLGLGAHKGLIADEHAPSTNTTRFSLFNDGSGNGDSGMLESDPFNTGTAGSKSLRITLGSTGQELCLLVVAIAPSTTIPLTGSPMII